MKHIATVAEIIAKKIKPNSSEETVRDTCDSATYGELNNFELDMLVDEVLRRVKANP